MKVMRMEQKGKSKQNGKINLPGKEEGEDAFFL
jgi:hypothetical protein